MDRFESAALFFYSKLNLNEWNNTEGRFISMQYKGADTGVPSSFPGISGETNGLSWYACGVFRNPVVFLPYKVVLGLMIFYIYQYYIYDNLFDLQFSLSIDIDCPKVNLPPGIQL